MIFAISVVFTPLFNLTPPILTELFVELPASVTTSSVCVAVEIVMVSASVLVTDVIPLPLNVLQKLHMLYSYL